MAQRRLELALASKWLDRLLSMFAHQAHCIPNLWKFMGASDVQQEWKDIFGDTRYSTLRVHTLTLSSAIKLYNEYSKQPQALNTAETHSDLVPWDERKLLRFLNVL